MFGNNYVGVEIENNERERRKIMLQNWTKNEFAYVLGRGWAWGRGGEGEAGWEGETEISSLNVPVTAIDALGHF